jgi:osmoprotectant transport system ATP-binding protein
LAQLDTPRDLLANPADSFVAGFVGRDRGYRALGFTPAGKLPLREEAVVALGEPLESVAERATDGWVLVVDAQQRPQGWLSAVTAAARTGVVIIDLVNLGGTLATEASSLREALDAALSSPSGRGVIVGDDGTVAGTVTASEVLARIEQQRSVSRASR